MKEIEEAIKIGMKEFMYLPCCRCDNEQCKPNALVALRACAEHAYKEALKEHVLTHECKLKPIAFKRTMGKSCNLKENCNCEWCRNLRYKGDLDETD